jgi:hypothetical protein
MAVTKDDVLSKAKELGLTLTDEQVNAYVVIGELPVKKEDGTGTPPDDGASGDDDVSEDKGLTEGMRVRLRKEKEKRLALKAEFDKNQKELEDLRNREKERQVDKDKAKGDWEKLVKDTQDEKSRFEALAQKSKDKFKDNAVRVAVESALLEAGVPSDRLSKAVRLFDIGKVEFAWTKEDDLEYEIDDFKSEVEAFKKDNNFLFEEIEDNSSHGFKGNPQPKAGGRNSFDKNDARIRELFSSLR